MAPRVSPSQQACPSIQDAHTAGVHTQQACPSMQDAHTLCNAHPARLQVLPPQIMKQLGGPSGLMNLMKSMESGGKMPGGLENMLGGMGGGRRR